MSAITPYLPNVNGLSVSRAALAYVEAGIPIVPFDPTKGKGKSCWNLLPYSAIATDKPQITLWRRQFGPFKALATCPGEIGWLVVDVDYPDLVPSSWWPHLDSAPYINTRPQIDVRKGHYWFTTPGSGEGRIGNPSFPGGEIRSAGGGIVLPPFEGRSVVRNGIPQPLPDEIATFIAGAGRGVFERVDLARFLNTYRSETKPYKVKGICGLYRYVLRQNPNAPHVAMREALKTGFSESVVGYVSAATVFDALQQLWPATRARYEFDSLARWCAGVAMATNPETVKLRSDRLSGSDSRVYANSTLLQPTSG